MAVAMIFTIALADLLVAPNISLGLLYFFPILLAAGCLRNLDIVAISFGCTLLRELLGPFVWTEGVAPRLITSFIAYLGTGALIREIDRHRKATLANARQLSEEAARRENTEQQLRGLVDGMPAAVVTLDPGGKVLLANEAAHELLGRESPSLLGESIDRYLPDLARLRLTSAVRHLVRTMIEGTAYRHDGQAFLAHIWVSSYGPPSATGITAVIFDASEQLRTHEEAGLHSLTTSARVILGAFWHETRNLCSAMRVLVSGMMHRPACAGAEELDGLKSLVDSLENLAYAEQHPVSEQELETASVRVVLEHLRIVIAPSFEEKQIAVHWRIADDVPLACVDQHGLLQVFLNLTKNAGHALENSKKKDITITTAVEDGRIRIAFHNSGPPVQAPERLFKPFQPGTSGGGLGLYVSRAIVRSFGGDVRWEPVPEGSCFVVELQVSQFWYTYGVGNQ
jgi:two-component system sensor kinase FixL